MNIKDLIELSGASFVNRYGTLVTGPISLTTLENIEKEIKRNILNKVISEIYDLVETLDDEEASGAHSVRVKVEEMFNNVDKGD